VWINPKTDFTEAELDELFWFTGTRRINELGINAYIMTMVSRNPRQIVAFDVDISVKSKLIQQMTDNVPPFEKYFTDGCPTYLDVIFPGRHKRNIHNKNDTYTVEGSNADLRHYIAGLRRKSRCFFRKVETIKAMLYIFINAYNKFGAAKQAYRERHPNCGRDFGFSHLQYI